MGELKVKRVYLPAEEQDGYRVLTDGLWPRGISKEKAGVDEWDKQLAPSTELRKWFGHQPELFPDFTEKYIGSWTITRRLGTLWKDAGRSCRKAM